MTISEGRFSEELSATKIKLDLQDKKILSLLSENSRRPITDLARRARLSADTTRYRIRRLRKLGVIQRYIPIVNFKRLNYYVFHVFMLLDESDREKRNALLSDLKNNDSVLSVIEYSDRWDLEVTMLAQTLVEFDKFMTGLATKFRDIILEKNKLETIRNYNMMHYPLEPFQVSSRIPKRKPILKVKVDSLDLRLLVALSEDSSRSNYDLAQLLSVSSDTIAYRIKRLVSSGVIIKFTVLVNLSLANLHWHTFCLQVKVLDSDHDRKFKEYITGFPKILRACKTLGDWDLLLYIVAEDSREFHATIKSIKNEFSDIIKNYETWLAYKEHCYCAFPKVMLRS
ncbi:MAG: Lrp/AsnC family transcriptional regulator [Candidatus Woesearchaeota archaeon]